MNGSGFLFHSERDIKIDFNCIFRFVCPFVHMNYWFHHHFGIIACVHIAYGCPIYIFEFIFQKYLLCMLNVLTTVVCWTCRYRYDFKSLLILLNTSTLLVDCKFFPSSTSQYLVCNFRTGSEVNDFLSTRKQIYDNWTAKINKRIDKKMNK